MDIDRYFGMLSENFNREYSIASYARKKGFDPRESVEILPAPDLASRVEGLIGLEGIGRLIRKSIGTQGRSRLAFDVAKEICTDPGFDGYSTIERIALAVRVGTAILTEGVLVAPTEGIQGIASFRNPDGTAYISVLYAGPIRGAGGTAAALSVALADFARRLFNIDAYRPTQEEIERYVEEVELYHTRSARLQYRPFDDDIRTIVSNCPVCVDGLPTETIDVSVHGNLRRLDSNGKEVMLTNRVRGGMALVVCEGIAQKAKKMLKETKNVGLDWSWLNNIIRVEIKKASQESDANAVFLEELVAGRPILAYPSHAGGFRLRYGRSRFTGIAAKGFSPSTMIIAMGFIATGTQVKVEYPGKGCVAMPVDSIEGPFVVLRDGTAMRINDARTAMRLREDVAEIISLGDILVTYGDFKKSNAQLRPPSYAEEVYDLDYEAATGRKPDAVKDFRQVYSASLEYSIPMHPAFLFEFQAVDAQALKGLAEAVAPCTAGAVSLFVIEALELKNTQEIKRTLELLCVPHSIKNNSILIEREYAQALAASLGFASGSEGTIGSAEVTLKRYEGIGSTLEFLNSVSPFRIMRRSTFIGARIGRPEKARERLMKPAPHVLFPIGEYGGKERNIAKAAIIDSRRFRQEVRVEIARYRCTKCMRIIGTPYCYDCESRAVVERKCKNCGAILRGERCEVCNTEGIAYEERVVNLPRITADSMKRLGIGRMPKVLKGVKGLSNRNKRSEMLEKGILRALNEIYIFKDGTVRFDATDVPLTHFYPREFNIGVERLRGLGYTKDYMGNELVSEDQLVELRHQDIILNRRGMDYFLRVSHFIDQLLEGLYGMEPFYKAMTINDMIGKMVITLSPHTSCGVLNRIIGYTDASVGFAHPYTISARRRNCDGDEDTAMLLLDALINFSREFMPGSIGGSMDTPLILTLNVMPEEVDDEVHAMETVERYTSEFYEKASGYAYPSEAGVEVVEDRLGKESIFNNIMFSHAASADAIADAPRRSRYTELKSMQEKVDAEFMLMDMIYAINKSDAARKLILSHFIPDIIGNLHSFSRQSFRCASCNAKYRRVPLAGRCAKDNGRLLLTISKGSIEKYLEMAIALAERYKLDPYIRQRLDLIKEEISGFFEETASLNATSGQFNLARYM